MSIFSLSLLLEFITGCRNEIQLILHFLITGQSRGISLSCDDRNEKASLRIPNDALHIVIAWCNSEFNITIVKWPSNMKAMVA